MVEGTFPLARGEESARPGRIAGAADVVIGRGALRMLDRMVNNSPVDMGREGEGDEESDDFIVRHGINGHETSADLRVTMKDGQTETTLRASGYLADGTLTSLALETGFGRKIKGWVYPPQEGVPNTMKAREVAGIIHRINQRVNQELQI